MDKIDIIQGGSFTDQRGTIAFVNDFNMNNVKRIYFITNADVNILRGWRGHKIEQRWFMCITGDIEISTVKIDNWLKPDQKLPVTKTTLTEKSVQFLHVPEGYATLIKSLTPNAKLLVLGSHDISHASNDDYLYAPDYFRL